LQGYDKTGITEMWWDGSYDWSAGMEGHSLFGKDREGRQGGGIALYFNDQLWYMEIRMGKDEEPMESLQVRIKGKEGTGDITVRVC